MRETVELQERRKVIVTEEIPIPRQTVTGLMETFQAAFTGKYKPTRLLYTKGGPLVVERSLLTTDIEEDDPFLTPYQMIRQHADLEIQETISNSLLACCTAMQEVRRQGFDLTCAVCRTVEEVRTWLPEEVQLDKAFGVELLSDPDCPEGCLFFCGSETSPMIRDIEKSILCRMG